ncbi:MAG: hypothetical protein K6G73_12075 [Marinilabiliaceae bacterium]|nr:hypothetical protein [Marinilabiliaceae bacterium]
MKNIYPLAIALFLFASQTIVAQNNEPDIMAQQSHSEKIEKCRNLVYDKTFNSHDTATVHELLNYAKTSLETSGNLAFYLDEYRVLYLLNGFYPELLYSVKNEDDSTFYANLTYKITPRENLYLYQALVYVRGHQDEIKGLVAQSTSITAEEKEFISLYINYVISHDREEINGFCDEYLTTNPAKPLETFTRKYMRYKYEPYHKFGVYMGWALGSTIHTQSLADIDNVGFDFGGKIALSIYRWQLQFSMDCTLGKTHQDLDDGWKCLPRDEKYEIDNLQILIGYKLPLQSRWYVLPSIGINHASVRDNLPQNERIDFSVDDNRRPCVSVEFGRDLLLLERGPFSGKMNYGYWQLGIRYAMFPTTFHMQSGDYTGIAHNVAITFGLGFSRARRVY